MAQPVKALATNVDSLSSILGFYMVKGKNWPKDDALWPTHTHTKQQIKKFSKSEIIDHCQVSQEQYLLEPHFKTHQKELLLRRMRHFHVSCQNVECHRSGRDGMEMTQQRHSRCVPQRRRNKEQTDHTQRLQRWHAPWPNSSTHKGPLAQVFRTNG